MINRFSHLKKKRNNSLPVEDFIGNASKSSYARIANKQKLKKSVLLSIAGKMDRELECVKPIQLYLKKDVSADLKKFCHGNNQAILNYIIRKGLDQLIAENELVLVIE